MSPQGNLYTSAGGSPSGGGGPGGRRLLLSAADGMGHLALDHNPISHDGGSVGAPSVHPIHMSAHILAEASGGDGSGGGGGDGGGDEGGLDAARRRALLYANISEYTTGSTAMTVIDCAGTGTALLIQCVMRCIRSACMWQGWRVHAWR